MSVISLEDERQTPAWQWGEVLLIVLVFFIATGDPTPSVNETHYISRLKHYWNPQWCAGDLFLESTDTQVVFIWLFGWLTRFLSLSATAWIGRLAAWLLQAWAWQRLSWRLIPRPLASVLSAALFLTLNFYCQMAGEWVVGGVEAKCFAYAFVLLALSELASKPDHDSIFHNAYFGMFRWRIQLPDGFALNQPWSKVCLFLGAAIAFHPLVGGWSALVCATMWLLYRRREQPFSKMLPGVIGGSLLAIVGVLPALSLTWHEPAELVAEANRIYVFERLPHHLAILSMPGSEVQARLVRHGALLIALAAFGFAARGEQRLRPIIYFAWGAAIIAAIGLVIELALLNQPLTAAKVLKYYWFRLTDFAAPMAVALLAVNVISFGLEQKRRWAIVLLIVTVFFAGFYLEEAIRPRVTSLLQREPLVPPADSKVVDYDAWVDVCDWIAANTPPDALFLTPRLNQSFKWRAGRAEVVNRKDVPQDARSMLAWDARVKDIYNPPLGITVQSLDSIGTLGSTRVAELAKKYHANYVLMDRSELLSLPAVYRNEEYVVYRVEN